jgi:hypothetical protein
MTVTCHDFQALGEALVQEADEVKQRAGISRLFYGALHRSDEWATGKPGVASDGGVRGTHAKVEHKLRNLDPQCSADEKKAGRVLAALLGSVKKRRVAAEYDLNTSFDPSEIAAQVGETEQIFHDCASR